MSGIAGMHDTRNNQSVVLDAREMGREQKQGGGGGGERRRR